VSEHDPHDVDIFEVPELPDTDDDHEADSIPVDAEPVDYEPTDEDDTDEVE
jgi:hypothetical protein